VLIKQDLRLACITSLDHHHRWLRHEEIQVRQQTVWVLDLPDCLEDGVDELWQMLVLKHRAISLACQFYHGCLRLA